MNRLDNNFYKKSAIELAPKLLGKFICRRIGDKIIKYKITETECYYGEDDSACHASKGKTKRNQILYNEGGVVYVYLCYGVHILFNVVTGEKNHPEAVLIRGIEGFSGPGKLTKELQIDISFYGVDLTTSEKIWIEDDDTPIKYLATPRIGIKYAQEKDKNALWRFIID